MSTSIEWTDETKRCSDCRLVKPLSEFCRDRSRVDGRAYRCNACRNARARETYTTKTKPRELGKRVVAPRDGDYRQARRRVNYLVDCGLLPSPNAQPCVDCGHRWAPGERRHEYDHHLGYAAIHHEDVQPVCSTCHHARENLRRAG